MNWQAWRKAAQLYVHTLKLIYESILVAIAIFGFAWWLWRHISKKRIAALQERLRLGKQVQEHITNEVQSLKQKVSIQGTTINNLRSTGGVPRREVELLSSANGWSYFHGLIVQSTLACLWAAPSIRSPVRSKAKRQPARGSRRRQLSARRWRAHSC